ncbi:MAG: zinc ribbon domain-containing protein [Enterocloster citroniae]|nr:zinc ribbon domain-containing protein [Enterocloster citroniae]
MFRKLKENLDKGIVSASVKSSTYLEAGKLKTKAGNVLEKMKMASSEMGEAVYNQWKSGGIDHRYIEAVCSQIKEMEDEAEGYRNQIKELEQEKNKILGKEGREPERAEALSGVSCDCGCLNEAGARFCMQCGKELKAPKEPEETRRVCPSCGMEAEPGARFCMGCGKPLDA